METHSRIWEKTKRSMIILSRAMNNRNKIMAMFVYFAFSSFLKIEEEINKAFCCYVDVNQCELVRSHIHSMHTIDQHVWFLKSNRSLLKFKLYKCFALYRVNSWFIVESLIMFFSLFAADNRLLIDLNFFWINSVFFLPFIV